jgi:hypothetical protein
MWALSRQDGSEKTHCMLHVFTIEILVLHRTRMFALVQQTFWAKKTCKKSADLHPRQGNLRQSNLFTGLNKTTLLQHKIGWKF